MSLFPRFTQEFAPMFRLFDEYDRHAFRDLDRSFKSMRSFTPKFDVRETSAGYELHGDLPGVDQKNINIEWTDNNTLTISGRHEHTREHGDRPTATALLPNSAEQDPHNDNNSTSAPLDHHHNNNTNNDKKQTTHQDITTTTTTTNTSTAAVKQAPPNPDEPKYWVSERSVGEFHRSFAFPARVDQDGVKASLKNGVLSIVVPKAGAARARRIAIE